MTFETDLAAKHANDAKMQELYDARKALIARVAAELGISQAYSNGLTPDAIKFHPEVRAAWMACNAFEDKMRRFNRAFMKAHRKQYDAYAREIIAAKRAAALQSMDMKGEAV